MKGLLLKEIYSLKRYISIISLLMAFYLALSVKTGNPSMLMFVITFIFIFVVLSSFAYDEATKWDRYAIAMPLTRKTIVLSKYLLMCIVMVLGLALTVAAIVVYSFFDTQYSVIATVPELASAIVAGLFLMSFYIPATYQFGVEKSRLILMGVFVITMLVGSQFIKPLKIFLSTEYAEQDLKIVGVMVVLLFIASYFLSVKIYSRKEF